MNKKAYRMKTKYSTVIKSTLKLEEETALSPAYKFHSQNCWQHFFRDVILIGQLKIQTR